MIDNDELAKIVHINERRRPAGLPHAYGPRPLPGRRRRRGARASASRRSSPRCPRRSSDGARFLVLSDRDSDADLAPIPSLLLTSAVHHHLIREKTRTQVGLLVEAGDVREVHHVALLIGYGAAAVNPYLAMETRRGPGRAPACITGRRRPRRPSRNLIKALGKGVLKVMCKMGISTVASYRGAQVFEAIGLAQELVDHYFTGTTSQLGGIGLDVLAAEVAARHARGLPGATASATAHRTLEVGGEYQWRREGEPHLFDPETVFRLQHSTRARRYDVFKQYTAGSTSRPRG